MKNLNLKLKIITLATVVIISSYGHASPTGFEGTKVQMAGYCCTNPTESNRISDVLQAVVGSETEFPLFENSGRRTVNADIDVSNSQVEVKYAEFTTLSSGLFNGFVFDFGPIDSFPKIKNISLNPATTFDLNDIDLSFDSDTVRISIPGQRVTPDSRILVDVSFFLEQIPPVNNDCVANFSIGGELHIPCISVPDVFTGNQMYQADMMLIPSSNPLSFELQEANKLREAFSNNCVAIYNSNGTLSIPCIAVSDVFGGIVIYHADMELIPLSSPFIFRLIDAQQSN